MDSSSHPYVNSLSIIIIIINIVSIQGRNDAIEMNEDWI